MHALAVKNKRKDYSVLVYLGDAPVPDLHRAAHHLSQRLSDLGNLRIEDLLGSGKGFLEVDCQEGLEPSDLIELHVVEVLEIVVPDDDEVVEPP